jgi:hypothetical protein
LDGLEQCPSLTYLDASHNQVICSTKVQSKNEVRAYFVVQITAVGDISQCGSLLTLQLQSNLLCSVESLSRSGAVIN